MNLKNHISFIKDVFIYTLTAFGGPQGHIGMIQKTFVDKGKYLSQNELLDYYSFCQLLPGASSTQLLGCIGYKKGGIFLSLISLFIWLLPASIIMGIFCILLLNNADSNLIITHLFYFIKPMTLGFLLYSSWTASKNTINNNITRIIFIFGLILIIFFFKTPWIFPLLIISGGIITNISKKRYLKNKASSSPKKYYWIPLFLFLFIFISAGFLSEQARKENWENRKMFNLFENFYRFGSIVFGGGDVLFPMMLDQYVARPTDKKTIEKNPNIIKIDKEDLLVGFGMVRSIPGPVFSVGSYVGGVAFKNDTKEKQITGCIIGTFSLFLPGILLMFFFFPIFQQIKQNIYILRAMEGIHAVILSFMFGAAFFLFSDYTFLSTKILCIDLFIVISTFILLRFSKLPSPIIVVSFLLLGLFIGKIGWIQ